MTNARNSASVIVSKSSEVTDSEILYLVNIVSMAINDCVNLLRAITFLPSARSFSNSGVIFPVSGNPANFSNALMPAIVFGPIRPSMGPGSTPSALSCS